MPDHMTPDQLAHNAAQAANDLDFTMARYWAVEAVRRLLRDGGNCRVGFMAACQEAAELLQGVGLAVAEARTPDAEARPSPPTSHPC